MPIKQWRSSIGDDQQPYEEKGAVAQSRQCRAEEQKAANFRGQEVSNHAIQSFAPKMILDRAPL